MNSFWHSLQRIAHGQLFAHGYLAPRTAVELANRPEAPQPRDCGGGGTRAKAILATPGHSALNRAQVRHRAIAARG